MSFDRDKWTSRFPNHLAIIMDGNGRWAEKRGLPRLDGHRAGVKRLRNVIKVLDQHEIKYVTLYSFSTENWNRPQEEVQGLMILLEENIESEVEQLHCRGARLKHIGRLHELPEHLQQSIIEAVKLTENNKRMTITFALNYGGRTEIVDAARKLLTSGVLPDSTDEESFTRYLYTADLPDVDLVIRTGGEKRISNFLLWQAAYAEYYFTSVLWPDFTQQHIEKALQAYSRRKRRFGGL